ncbi:PDC sensor domain-containing protein [Halalkalibacter alkalisediminis]|uniref:Cache domain-containing protein n=1 Tax=Halalkalibacter alkalisediminis TaxID=935616 RepID=A0ABV6NGH8_9BACI|nr:cache domain-containing protein [Halalkalibacter alkalisediminis]
MIRTLRFKLIILFLFIGLVPLGLTSAILYSISSQALIEEGEKGLEEISISTGDAIEQWFEKRVGEVGLAARTDNMKSLDEKQQLSLVKMVKEQSNSYETVVFTGTDGVVRAHTTEENIGTLNLADRDYFQKGMSGESFISDVLTSRATGNRIVVVAAPVQGDNGDILGVMSASVNFEQLVSEFINGNHSQDLIPVLLDNQNVIQAHPVSEWVGLELSESGLSPEVKALMEGGRSDGAFFI